MELKKGKSKESSSALIWQKGLSAKLWIFFSFISRVFEVKIFIRPTLSGARIFVFEIPEATRIKFHHFTGI